MNIKHSAGLVLATMLVISDCHARETPTQVVYRFDDQRYLKSKGGDCKGKSGIRTLSGVFIPNLLVSFIGFLPTNISIRLNDIKLLLVGRLMVFGFQETTKPCSGENEPDGMN